jgi:protein O-GlcNAc transferase
VRSILILSALLLCPAIEQEARAVISEPIQTLPKAEEVSEAVLALIQQGDALLKAKRYDEAIAQYTAAIAKADKPPLTAYLNLGSANYEKEDFPAALEAFRKAIEIKPGDFRGYYNLAEVLYLSKAYQESEAEYRRVLALVPRGLINTQGRYFLGLAVHKQGRVDEAIEHYRTAIAAAGGKYAEAHYNLGVALLERKEYAEAEREFRTSIEQDRTFPLAHFNLAATLEYLQHFPEAIEEYESYLRLSPNGADAATVRSRIERLKQQK